MLPGIRFLLAAVVLSMSILIFGLGAAALLRAAHEEFASMPARRTLPEPVFAQQAETPAPTLALLRVEPASLEKTPGDAPAALPAWEPAPEAVPVPTVETDKLAALALDDVAPAEGAKPEPQTVATEAPAPAAQTAEPAPAAPAETKTAAVETAPVLEAAPSLLEPTAAPANTETNTVTTSLAALDSPAAVVAEPPAKQPGAKPDDSEAKKKRAERAKERRRLAARRARLAAQQAAALAAQQAANPFAPILQPAQPAATTTRRP